MTAKSPSTDYPSTRTQQETARRRGWYKNRLGVWEKPKDFTWLDEKRIRSADRRRQDRSIGAD